MAAWFDELYAEYVAHRARFVANISPCPNDLAHLIAGYGIMPQATWATSVARNKPYAIFSIDEHNGHVIIDHWNVIDANQFWLYTTTLTAGRDSVRWVHSCDVVIQEITTPNNVSGLSRVVAYAAPFASSAQHTALTEQAASRLRESFAKLSRALANF